MQEISSQLELDYSDQENIGICHQINVVSTDDKKFFIDFVEKIDNPEIKMYIYCD